jgi:hypothetical protein
MNKPLSREYLLNQGSCCDNDCTNCPYKTEETIKMGKTEKYGSYVCKVGYLDIRQKIEMPRVRKTNRGDTQQLPGKVEVFVYQGKHQLSGPFKSHKLAKESAIELVENNVKFDKHKKLI